MKKILLYTFLGFIGLLFTLAISTHTSVDTTPYQQMPYYKQTMAHLDSMTITEERAIRDSLSVGWAKVSLLPQKAIAMAGYGAREGKLMEGVRDTVWVRAFVLDNGLERVLMFSADLLIIPSEVTRMLKTALPKIGLSLDKTYMSATHTHCSIGGWDPTFVGELFAGTYDPEMITHITQAIVKAATMAAKDLQPAQLGFSQVAAEEYVHNRLVEEKGIEDPWLRMMKFERTDGRTALWLTYAAHATCLNDAEMRLSQDYPGELVRLLETRQDIDFACFSAGAVGSHGPESGKVSGDDAQIQFMAQGLYEKAATVLDSIALQTVSKLTILKVPIYLREPHFRLNTSIRSRPWVFRQLVGENHEAYISALRIGDNVLLATPCDFSGELIPELKAGDYNLMVTSFNGAYIGYITKDEWYDLDSYETRVMNWFGPYNGAYFVEVMNKLITLM